MWKSKSTPKKRCSGVDFKIMGKLTQETIQKSFFCCGVTCAIDGSEDDKITCFKAGQPCSEGRDMLKNQHELLLSSDEENPFISEDDVNEACPPECVLDEDEEDDEDIDVTL